MNNKGIKLEKICINVMKIITICILMFLCIASFLYTAYFYTTSIDMYHEGLYYKMDNILINIVGVISIFSIIIIISKLLNKTDKKVVLIISLLWVVIIGILWILFVKAPIKSDQGQVLADAKAFSKR